MTKNEISLGILVVSEIPKMEGREGERGERGREEGRRRKEGKNTDRWMGG